MSFNIDSDISGHNMVCLGMAANNIIRGPSYTPKFEKVIDFMKLNSFGLKNWFQVYTQSDCS